MRRTGMTLFSGTGGALICSCLLSAMVFSTSNVSCLVANVGLLRSCSDELAVTVVEAVDFETIDDVSDGVSSSESESLYS